MNRRTGVCPECGFSWSASSESVLASLQSCRARFKGVIAGATEDELRQRPFPEKWSALEYIGHTRDGVSWYEDRIKRALAENRPQLTGRNFALRTEEAQYHLESTDRLLEGVGEASESLASMLEGLAPEQWDRRAIGSDGDERDVLQLARRAAHETEHHCVDAEKLVRNGPV